MIFVVISSLQTLIMRIIILLLLICTACTNHRAEPKAFVLPQILSIAAPAIPVAVTDYTGLQFPGWSIVTKQDYHTGFWSFYDEKKLPFFTAVDINDDGYVDYGILIKKQDTVQLVILLNKNNSFTHQVAGNFLLPHYPDNKALQYCLLPEPPGQIDVVKPSIRSLILTTNAIQLMEMENRICIYYWNNTTIAAFQTL